MSLEDIYQANQAAREHRHPQRAMRVTLECGHMRLMSWHSSAMGISASTICLICVDQPSRLVVNLEETGILSDEFFKNREGAQ